MPYTHYPTHRLNLHIPHIHRVSYTVGGMSRNAKVYLSWILLGGVGGFALTIMVMDERKATQAELYAMPFVGLFLGCLAGALIAYLALSEKNSSPRF